MIPRCYTGEWIVENKKIEDFHLFYLLRADVQAFTNNGLKVVDRDPLLRKEFTLEHLKEEEWTRELFRRGTEETGIVITGRGGSRTPPRKPLSRTETDKIALRREEKLPKDKWTDPKGCKSISFTLDYIDIGRSLAILEAKTFRYISVDVDKYFEYEDNQSHPQSAEETPKGTADLQKQPVQDFSDGFIRSLQVSSVSDAEIRMRNMSSAQNDRNIFPLNLELLKVYAKRWVDKIPSVLIESITLYRYSTHYAEITHKKHSVKYCIVFNIIGESLPHTETADSDIDKIESFNRSIDDLLECFHTIRNQDSYLFLMDAGFSDVYHSKPDANFRDEWMFLTGLRAEGDPGIMRQEPCWVLFDVRNIAEAEVPRQKQAAGPAPAAFPDGNTIVRKAQAMAIANAVKKDFPNLTQKEAAQQINARLATMEAFDADGHPLMQRYNVKYLIKLIKPLGFKRGNPGNPGKKPKK